MVLSDQLLQFPGLLPRSEVLLLSDFPFVFHSHRSIAAMKVALIAFPHITPAAPLASPVSGMSKSL